MRETNYWIRLIIEIYTQIECWKVLQQESEELMKILGSIYSKSSTHK